jgi:hypothetical protein
VVEFKDVGKDVVLVVETQVVPVSLVVNSNFRN